MLGLRRTFRFGAEMTETLLFVLKKRSSSFKAWIVSLHLLIMVDGLGKGLESKEFVRPDPARRQKQQKTFR
jgi:hypothetical protein